MKDNNLFEKAVQIFAHFCELKDYEGLERNWSPEVPNKSVLLIAYDGDVLVSIDVTVKSGFEGFIPEFETDREAMEILAAKRLAKTDDESSSEARFDRRTGRLWTSRRSSG